MADSEVNLKIKVNSKEASSGVSTFVSSALNSIEGLNSSILDIGKRFGAVTVAAGLVGFAIKEALNFAKEAFNTAEEIANIADETNKVNKQFDFLAENAGGSSEALRSAFDSVNQGILDTEDILKSASVALVNLSIPTQDIAKNFEAARRLSVGMGVDSVQAFEAINTAIASGNTRVLKQIGLFVDADSAVKAYGESIGVSTKFLTDAQKETAIFNAIQAKVNDNFGNVDLATKTTSESFQEFGTAAKDLGEAVAIGLNKIFGPSVQALLGTFSEGLSRLANEILSRVGSQTEQVAAKQEILNDRIQDEMDKLTELQAISDATRGRSISGINGRIAAQQKLVESLQAQQEKEDTLAMKQQQANDFLKGADAEKAQLSAADIARYAERKKAQEAYAASVLGTETAVTQAALQRATTEQGIQEATAARTLQIDADTKAKLAENDRVAKENGLLGSATYFAAQQAIEDQALINKEQLAAESNQRIADSKVNQAILSGEIESAASLKGLAVQKTALDEQIKAEEAAGRSTTNLKLKQVKLEQDIANQKYAVTQTALGNLSTLMQSSSREAFEVGKAAAIASATIATFQSFNNALANIPAPFGAIVGATYLAAGFLQVSKIASTNLASGMTNVPAGFPNDSFSANLTSGERVVNVQQNKDLTSFLEEQQGNGQASDDSVPGLLSRVVRLLEQGSQQTTVVNIGNKEIMREVRDGIRSGQQVFA